MKNRFNEIKGMVNNSNVSLTSEVSGIMGLGFPRLSSIPSSVTNCELLVLFGNGTIHTTAATPFFAGLAQQGLLDYPLFGVSLTTNLSGSLTIGVIDVAISKLWI